METIHTQTAAGMSVVVLPAMIDSHEVLEFRDYLDEARRHNHGSVVVDLSSVTMMDSMVTGILVTMKHVCESAGGKLVLCQLSAPARELLHATHLDLIFEIVDTRQHAVELVKSVTPSGTAQTKPASSPSADAQEPLAVVRAYIEAWNSDDFQTEAETLTDEFRGLDKQSYILRRQDLRTKLRNAGEDFRHTLVQVQDVAISGSRALVTCLRRDETAGDAREYEQTFSLIRQQNQWRIRRVSSSGVNPTKQKSFLFDRRIRSRRNDS